MMSRKGMAMAGRHDRVAGTGHGRVLPLAVMTLLLTGCALPDLGGLGPTPRAPAPAPGAVAPDTPAPTDADSPPASTAEAACTRQGRDQGLNVREVVGTREVTDSEGRPVARDVMLRVARGEQVFDIRCNYRYAEARARIMSL